MTEKKITISDYYYKKTEIDNLLNSKEDKSNKVTSLSLNSTNDEYPTAKAVYDDVTNKYNALSNGLTNGLNSLSSNLNSQVTSIWDTLGPLPSTKEDKSNKVTSISSLSTDTEYPSAKAVYTTTNGLSNGISGVSEAFSGQVTNIWNTLGPLPNEVDQKEDKSNKVTSLSSSSTDDEYPSAKTVYTITNGLSSTKQDKITSTQKLNASYVTYTSYAEWLNLHAGSSQAVVNEKILSYLATVRDNKANKTEVPTKTSQLTNDSGFLTQHQNISGKEDTSNKVTSLSSSSTNTQYPSAKAVYDAIPSGTITLTATLENGTTKTFTIYGNENTGD